MKRMKLFGLMSVVVTMVAVEVFAGVATPSTIIVMPARRRLVEVANQIVRIKDVGLVAYDNSLTSADPLIHIWNGSEWLAISVADYTAGSFMSGEPKHLLLLGDSTTLPAALSADPTWCADVRRITTLGTSALLNEMHKTLKFSTRQWKWLAEQNGLVLTDTNAERRRYGRWGAPGNEAAAAKSKPSADVVISDDLVMPPAPIQPEIAEPTTPQIIPESPVVEPIKIAPPVVEPAPAEPVKVEPAKAEVKAVTPPAPAIEKPAEPVAVPPAEPAVEAPEVVPAEK